MLHFWNWLKTLQMLLVRQVCYCRICLSEESLLFCWSWYTCKIISFSQLIAHKWIVSSWKIKNMY